MMVPLTESLYVSGHVHEKECVLLELGAGYYAEVRASYPIELFATAVIVPEASNALIGLAACQRRSVASRVVHNRAGCAKLASLLVRKQT